MHAVIVTFEVLPEKVDLFRDAILANAATSLEMESGCVTFDVLQSPAAPQFMLYEIYRSAEAFKVHLGMSHFHDFDRLSSAWVVSKKVEEYGRIESAT
ncbi:antibiotic biosynthesis monooxygenase (plasmid) [Cupriavidus pinatubonensis]|uniref:putative quinol monooxygenase n=1 Tax=Cupriavidus pinatubonensis TaxID=248026 RepID=UPI001C72BF83|nr:putative quinol monooxygenase [Cupriavidus pinatubonensis]QYY33865.1 antibiotic biosynthesis monooxygenase [Cupriavidus pinatubonensis]